MRFSISEHRLLSYRAKEDSMSAKDGDPDWSFGDAPLLSTVRIGNNSFVKVDARTGVGLNGGHERNNIDPATPIENIRLPSAQEMRTKYEILLKPDRHSSGVPLALNQVFQANRMQKLAQSQNGPLIGPSHNAADRLREWMDFDTVPDGSFFTIDRHPDAESQVYLKDASEYCLPICQFSDWQEGLTSVTVNLKKEKAYPEFLGAGVLVLSAMNLADYDRDMAVLNDYRRQDGLPIQEDYMAERRGALEAFWSNLEQKRNA